MESRPGGCPATQTAGYSALHNWNHRVMGTLCNKIFPFFFFFSPLRFYLFIFREGKGEREGEKHQCVVASRALPTEDLACNPGMFPDWESDQQPFDSFIGRHSIHWAAPARAPPIFQGKFQFPKNSAAHLWGEGNTRRWLILCDSDQCRVHVALKNSTV